MFELMKNGSAICTADYKDIKKGAIVPRINELWSQVQEWSDANGGIPNYDDSEELLNKAKESKRSEIRSAFDSESASPVVVNNVSYHGGFDSAIKLDAAKRLAETAGMTQVEFFDIDNVGHVLSLEDAQQVVVEVSGKYQQDLAKKQALMVQIKNATAEADLEVIVW